MVVFAPVSGGIIRRFGGKSALIAGAAVMVVGYVGRVFFWDSITSVIIGSTVVSIGTAIAYAAMPTLIMGAVPITETASANGLNSLVRSIGTSTSSAAVAAVLTSVTITVGIRPAAVLRGVQGRLLAGRPGVGGVDGGRGVHSAGRGRRDGRGPSCRPPPSWWCRAAS